MSLSSLSSVSSKYLATTSAAGGGGGGFNPSTDISDCFLWYDASNSAGCTTFTGSPTLVKDIKNLSGTTKNRDLTSYNNGSTATGSILNWKTGVESNNGLNLWSNHAYDHDHYFQSKSSTDINWRTAANNTPLTIAIVMGVQADDPNAGADSFLGWGTSTYGVWMWRAGNNKCNCRVLAGGGNRTTNIANSPWYSTLPIALRSIVVTIDYKNDKTQEMFLNNVSQDLNIAQGPWTYDNYPFTTFRLGRTLDHNPGMLRGHIGEVLIYEKKLNSTELSDLHSYLSNKWDLTS